MEKLAPYRPSCEAVDTEQLYLDALASVGAIEAGIGISKYPKIKISSDAGPHLQDG
jgi:hypothetical protein